MDDAIVLLTVKWKDSLTSVGAPRQVDALENRSKDSVVLGHFERSEKEVAKIPPKTCKTAQQVVDDLERYRPAGSR